VRKHYNNMFKIILLTIFMVICHGSETEVVDEVEVIP
jgi:hypothetical protein